MISLRVLGFCILSSLAPLAIGCSAETADTDEGIEDGDQAISANDRSTASKLLGEAQRAADKRLETGACESEGATVSEIVAKLREAVKKQPTKSFRKRIAASKAIKRAVGHTLDYHYLVGTITIEQGVVLGLQNATADAESGIEIYSPPQGAYGNMKKVRLLADGRATFWELRLDDKGEAKPTQVDWSWSLEQTTAGSTLTFGTGDADVVLGVEFDGEGFSLPNRTKADDRLPTMVSLPSECEA